MPTSFFSSLKDVAGSPYALIAYIILVCGWVFVSYRSNRLKLIGRTISHLPENDRKDLLIQEYGIYLKEGMSAQDYLRGKRQAYIFYFFLALILMITVITVVSMMQSSSKGIADSDKPNDPLFCSAIDSAVNNIANGFAPLRGEKDPRSEPGNHDFLSKVRVPGTKHNKILISPADTMYFAVIYNGGDKTVAFEHYINFTQLIRKCKDDWVIVPVNNDQQSNGILEYTSFVQDNKKITITFNRDQDSTYASSLLIVNNNKEKQ